MLCFLAPINSITPIWDVLALFTSELVFIKYTFLFLQMFNSLTRIYKNKSFYFSPVCSEISFFRLPVLQRLEAERKMVADGGTKRLMKNVSVCSKKKRPASLHSQVLVVPSLKGLGKDYFINSKLLFTKAVNASPFNRFWDNFAKSSACLTKLS